MSNETPQEFLELTQNEMSGLYLKLSVSENDNFDVANELSFISETISQIYDETFLKILTEDLQKNVVLLNNSFVTLLKFLASKNYKNVSLMFVGYCDYFDLDFEKTFKCLHEKLQNLIKQGCRKFVGESTYKKYNKVLTKNSFPTLFDLVNKKS